MLISLTGSLFIVKSLYDLIDIKIHRGYYDKLRRNATTKQVPLATWSKNLIECPNCKYMCQTRWKTCPICYAQLKRR